MSMGGGQGSLNTGSPMQSNPGMGMATPPPMPPPMPVPADFGGGLRQPPTMPTPNSAFPPVSPGLPPGLPPSLPPNVGAYSVGVGQPPPVGVAPVAPGQNVAAVQARMAQLRRMMG